jgi:flavin reductase (DIM6/NTAB) family NADH-FMN oxidoreductase RutF
MELSPDSLPWNSLYKLLTGSVLPRPIGWISTLAADGSANLAPFSFFNVVCANPPTVLFCPMVRGTDLAQKDTLRNVRETSEFVVNIVSEDLIEAMNLTSTELASSVDEFELARLEKAPSTVVRPPGVAASRIRFECRASLVHQVSDQPGGGSVILGKVVHIHVAESVLIGADKINLAALKPVGKLAGNSYCRVTDLFDLERPKPKLG